MTAPIKTVEVTRVFDAPRALVFKAWTDETMLAAWWGPKGFTNPLCKLDLRPGGKIRIDMAWPDGEISPMTGEFREILSPERIVFTSGAFPDEAGVPALENLNTVIFTEEGAKTRLTVKAEVLRADREKIGPALDFALAGMEEGWTMSLDKLDAFVATKAGAL